MGSGGDRLCQTRLIPRSPDGDKKAYTDFELPNEIEKLLLMVSQWPPVFPTWSNLVQVDIQPKHPDPATLHRGSSTKCAHRGWLCIAQGAIL